MTDDSPVSLRACKLVEKGANGELVLLKENLTKFLQGQEKSEVGDTPIAVVSVLGAKQSGSSFFTNLLAEYLKYNGQTWIKEAKKSGLKGFPFGPADNRVSGDGVDGEEMGSGVYFWPRLFALEHCNGRKLLMVIHVHRKGDEEGDQSVEEEDQELGRDAMDMFLGVASSRILDIVWKGMSVATGLHEKISEEMKNISPHFCQSIIYLERRGPGETEESRNGRVTKDNSITLQESSTPLHDQRGIIKFSFSQQGTVSKLIRKITDETELEAKKFGPQGAALNIGSLEDFLEFCISLVNSSRGINGGTTLTSSPVHAHSSALTVTVKSTNSSEDLQPMEKKHSENNNNPEKSSKSMTINDNQGHRKDGTVNSPQIQMDDEPMDCTPAPERNEDTKSAGVNDKNARLDAYKNEFLTRPIWPKLLSCLMQWVNGKLARDNIAEIPNIFDNFVSNINLEELSILKSHGMSEHEATLFILVVRQETNIMKYKNSFQVVADALQCFNTSIEEGLSKVPYVPLDEFKSTCEVFKGQIAASIETKVIADLFELGAEKLFRFYEMQNQRRFQEEKSISKECIHQIRTFYQQEMSIVAPQNQIQSPRRLAQIHQRLVLSLGEILARSMGTIIANIPEELDELVRQLGNDFVELQRKNTAKFEMGQKNVNSLILKGKSEYETKMDELLEKYPEGVPREMFDAEDRETEREIIDNFRAAVATKFGDGASVDNYLLTLNYYIEQSRDGLREDNEANLRDNRDKKAKPLAPVQPQILAPEVNNKKEKNVQQPTGINGLPPLLIQLGVEKIGIGIIKADSVEVHFLSPSVGLTDDNEWVCGNEIKTPQASHDGQPILKNHWNIGECLLLPNPKQSTTLGEAIVNDVKVAITTELLLAIYFRNAKQTYYAECSSDAKITVPFWSTSIQRQQVLDAAQIAGFTNVHLINENSAVAYYMYESGQHGLGDNTIVLSENSNMLDMTMYSFDPQEKKLMMLSHCGDCDTTTVPPTSNKSWIKSLFSFLNFFGQSTPDREKLVVDKMCKMYEKVVDRGRTLNWKQTSSVKNFVISYQTERGEDLLLQVARSYSEKPILTMEDSAICGMASIYKVIATNNKTGLSAETIIQEGMPFYVNVYPPHYGERRVPFVKKDTFSIRPIRGQGVCLVPKQSGKYRIVQQNVFSCSTIGNLEIPYDERNKRFTDIAITLKRSHQGIISLANLEWSKKMYRDQQERQKIATEAYEWRQCSISDEDKAMYLSLMDCVNFHNSLSVRLAKEKELTEKMYETIVTALNENRGNFTNPVLKALVVNQVNEAMAEVRNPQITETELKQKRTFLRTISNTYNLG